MKTVLMKPSSLWAVGTVMVAFVAGHLGAQGETTVSGTVVDAVSRRPIGGAVVRLQAVPARATQFAMNASEGSGVPPPPPEAFNYHASLMTDADGRFRFTGLRSGNYQVTAGRNGWIGGAWETADPDLKGDWMVVRPSANAVVTLPMRRAPVIAGRVVDQAGNPVIGVQVRAFAPRSFGGHIRWGNWLPRRTDDRGAFRVWVDQGVYLVGVTPAASVSPAESLHAAAVNGRSHAYGNQYFDGAKWSSAASVLSLSAGDERTNLQFRLVPEPTFRISGKVSGADDPSRVMLRLHALDEMLDWGSDDPKMIAPDAEGRFVFGGVRAGRYRIRAASGPNLPMGSHGVPALQSLPAESTLAGGADVQLTDRDVDLTLSLLPGVRINGRVEFDGDVSPAALDRLKNIPVIVEPADGSPFGHARGIYVDGRTFTTTQVPPGKYTVRTYAPQGWLVKSIDREGRSLIDKAFEVGAHDVNEVVITFTNRPSLIAGLVTNAPAARRRPWVVAFPVDRDQWVDYGRSPRCIAMGQVGTLGTYELWLPAGGYYVVAVYEQPGPLAPATFERLAGAATQVWLGHGERRDQPLNAVAIEGRR